jgi:hypothetical protein
MFSEEDLKEVFKGLRLLLYIALGMIAIFLLMVVFVIWSVFW